MLVLNYTLPLTPKQLRQLSVLAEEPVTVRQVLTQYNQLRPVLPQAEWLLAQAELLTTTDAVAFIPPSHMELAVVLTVLIKQRLGQLPLVARLRYAPGPREYDIVELVNLNRIAQPAW